MDRLLAPNTAYTLRGFDPVSGATGTTVFVTGPTGTGTDTSPLPMINTGDPTLADGLTAKQAFIIGVDPSIASNLAPGLTDLAALQQGLFADTGLPTSTGIQASVALKGEARAIALAGNQSGPSGGTQLLALVATGSYGLAVVDGSDAKQPVVLSQLQLAGGAASGIAVDAQAQVAAVADGPGGLQLISYADLANPTVIATAPGNFTHVVLLGGVAYASTGGTVQALDAQTGELLGTLGGAQGAVTGLALDGATLYAMDTGRVLRAVALVGGAMTVLGSVLLPGGGNGLVVGNGVATVPAGDAGGNGGYLTVDVSDPTQPKLIAGVANAGLAGSAAALNGSGLGLFAGQIQVRARTLQNDLDLVNTSDPTSTGALVTRFSLPAAPGDVAISGGLGFVADGAGGLQVVRYAAYTPNTVAPTLTVTQGPADIDPATPGTQVLEGASVPLGIQVSSPGQVRSVEVLLNGQSVLTSLSYPFNLSVALPTIAANGGSAVGLQVRATDTNGNVTTTASIALQLVPDLSPPRLVSATIAEHSVISTSTKTLLFTFSKALQPGAAAAGVFTLRDAAGAAIQPTAIALVGGGRTVQASYGALPVGSYSYTVQASAVFSASGVPLGAGAVTTDFTVQAFSTEWAPRTGGLWQTPANWTTGAVPTAADSAFIGVRLPVVFGSGAGAAAVLVDSNGELDVTGGTLTVGQPADLPAGTLSISGGAFAPNGTAAVGQLILSGGALGGTGVITATAGLQWTGGAMLAGGLTVTGPAAAYAILGGVALARELDLGGAGAVSGTLTLGNGGAAGVLAVAAGGALSLAGTLTADGTAGDLVRNAGTISASGTGTLAGVSVAGEGKLLAAGANTLNLQSATVSGGALAATGGGVIQTVDRASVLAGVAILAGGAVTVANNTNLTLQGALANAGTLLLASVGNYTALAVAGAVTLQGGTVQLSDNFENRIISNGVAATLTNAGLIQGAGRLGDTDGNFTLSNAGTVNATGVNGIVLNTGGTTVANAGLLEGTGAGGLVIQNTAVDNTAGGTLAPAQAGAIVASGAGAHVDLQTAALTGGTLTTAGGGVIQTVDRGSALANGVLSAGSTLTVGNNTSLTLRGTLTDGGTVLLASVGNYTALAVAGAVTLQGGTVQLSDNFENRIVSNGAAATLTNTGVIQGTGRLGDADNNFTLSNAGTVNATGVNGIVLNTGGTTVANVGLLEGTGAGGLVIQNTAVDNTGGGRIVAAGAGAHVDLQTATILGGTLTTTGGGVIQTVDRGSVLRGGRWSRAAPSRC